MKFLGNLIWFIFGGLIACLAWSFVGLIFSLTIIGIPIGLQFFKIASLSLFPFGREVTPLPQSGHLIFNLIWIAVFGWPLASLHLASACLLCFSIIGIPFAVQSVKLAILSLFPFGVIID